MGHPISLINPDLFWAKVEMAPGGCWKWTGRLDRDGYGKYQVKNGGVQHYFIAHRAAYELALSTIPEGLVIDHLCRNVSCVNPDHLEAVTQAENLRRQADANRPTHCPQGHELIDPYIDGNSRKCRTCVKERVRLRRQRLAGADCLVGTD